MLKQNLDELLLDSRRWTFATRPMNFIDFIAIVPLYIELIVQAAASGDAEGASSLAVVRIIRIARIFRLLKLGKHNEGLEVMFFHLLFAARHCSIQVMCVD